MLQEAPLTASGHPPTGPPPSSGSQRWPAGQPPVTPGSGTWPQPRAPQPPSPAPPGAWAGIPPTATGSRAPGSAPLASGSSLFRAARAAAAALSDRFELGEELGRGAMGVVFRAVERQSGRAVALKVLLDQGNARRQERFRREGLIAAGLDHPGIVRALDAGESQGVVWLACELVEGGRSLHEAWSGGDVPGTRRQRVEQVRDAARALGHAHARGIVHRDVKPANVLLDPLGRVRVTDFGLAAARGLERMTRTGAVVGTPQYMAPEQVTAERGEPSPATDVWALGVMLYQALTGETPFPGRDLVQLAVQICEQDPTPPRQRDLAIDPALEAVCLRALQRDPARRYPDGEALALDLDRALVGSRPRAVAEEGRRRGWRAALLGGLGVLLLGGGVAGLVVGRGGEPGGPAVAAGGATLTLDPAPGEVQTEGLDLSGSADPPEARVELRAGTHHESVRATGGRWSGRLPLEPGPNRVLVELVAGGQRVAHQELVVTRRALPAWWHELPASRRPLLPLPAGLEAGPVAGEYVHGKDGSRLVWVPPGRPRLGSADAVLVSEPPREVPFARGFWLGKFEVTWAQLWRFTSEVGREPPSNVVVGTTHGFEGLLSEAEKDRTAASVGGPDHPAFGVSWFLAQDYCRWAGLRLPTSLEWEYGARGLDARVYPWGEESRLDCYNGDTAQDGFLQFSPVGAFPQGASPWGCLDMIGNVWEWTATEVPAPNGTGTRRVVRGGAWNCVPFICKATHADMREPESRYREQGFRVARDP